MKTLIKLFMVPILIISLTSCTLFEDKNTVKDNDLLYLSTSYLEFKQKLSTGDISFKPESKVSMDNAVKAIDAFFQNVKTIDANEASIKESFTLFKKATRAVHEMNIVLADEEDFPGNLLNELLIVEKRLERISSKFNEIVSYATIGFTIHDDIKDVINIVNDYLKKL